jgi:hypothetical protein
MVRRTEGRIHFAAVASTVITAAVFAIVAVAYTRRVNPMWILIVPVVGGIAVAVCFMIAGQRADHAAISVETSAALGQNLALLGWRSARMPVPS